MENDHKEKQNFQFPKSILQGDTFYPDLFTFLIQSSNVCVCVCVYMQYKEQQLHTKTGL